jgi:dTDP-glucose 4,6-dehydratase
VEMVADVVDDILERDAGSSRSLVRSVDDRPGHDRRYAVRSDRIETDLGWRPGVTLDEGLRDTVEWYLANEAWVEQMTERSGDFEERWYRNR